MPASPEEILAWRGSDAGRFRLRGAERVFILSFATLDVQAAALNRVAALLERAGAPRDRVLGDAELAALITASGNRPELLYVGHNYRLADIERFFAFARRDAVPLNATERWLGEFAWQMRAAVSDGVAALLTVTHDPRAGDKDAQRAILAHELSHGVFFTDADYAAAVTAAWRQVFGERERSAFRGWLGREGYDAGNEELMANEMQAYLLHTPDARFFRAEFIGMNEAELEALRLRVRSFLAQRH